MNNKKIEWLSIDAVLVFHAHMISTFGGSEGIRDIGLMESALARPQNAHAYGCSDLFELAALYTHGIAKNHPFIDGNKRTAFMAGAVFLDINGYELIAPEENATTVMIDLASGTINEKQYAEWLKNNTRKAE